MQVFISIPMNGRKFEDVKEQLNNIRNKFAEMDITCIDSYIKEKVDTKYPSIYYMGKSLEKMSNCNAVYFAEGWKLATGCMIERKVAESYGIKCLETDFIDIEKRYKDD